MLCILLARASCCASAALPHGRSHQLPGRTLKGAALTPPLRYGAEPSPTTLGGLNRGRASPFSLLAYRGCSRVSAPWSLTRLPPLCSSLVGSPMWVLGFARTHTGEPWRFSAAPFPPAAVSQPCSPSVLVAVATRPHRHFRCFTPALTAYVRFGSPARTANADGSSLPTTARPSSHVTLPAPHDGRWWASLRSHALLHRATPSALKGTGVPVAAEGQMRYQDCSFHPLLIPTACPALQVERNNTEDYEA